MSVKLSSLGLVRPNNVFMFPSVAQRDVAFLKQASVSLFFVPKFAPPSCYTCHAQAHTHTCADTVTHIRRNKSERRAALRCVLMYGRVWEWKDTSAAWLRESGGREGAEEWYGLTGVAMGTSLLKAGRVSEE